MKISSINILIGGLIAISSFSALGQDSLLYILQDELNREYEALKKQDQVPYYMHLRVSDAVNYSVTASFGSLVTSSRQRQRICTPQIRLGNYDRDNTRQIPGVFGYGDYSGDYAQNLPLDNNGKAIAQMIWQSNNELYKTVQKQYKQVINNDIKPDDKNLSPDFSRETPRVHYDSLMNPATYDINLTQWEDNLREISGLFKHDEDIIVGIANLQVNVERRYFVSTEGSSIIQNFYRCDLHISASIKADGGKEVPIYLSYEAFQPKDLPDKDTLIEATIGLVKKLKLLQKAPLAEPYTGPAIFSPKVTGVFFHEIFGHRIEGHRLKSESDGQTFKNKLNERVLPRYINVISDPILQQYADQDLFGHYKYDDQGVKAEKVFVVEEGILKTFLMSRRPILNIENSNGHGRAEPGQSIVSRQSNLIVQSSKQLDGDKMKKMLIKECKRQNKPYGYYFKEVTGGFTTTDRYMPNAFNIMPTEVYRIYVDGRPDELVRGVDLIGTPLAMFSEIEATGNETGVFVGYCGAESGNVPVTTIAPSIFVNQIETQRKPESEVTLPLLKSPELEMMLNKTNRPLKND
ncbi:MAG TPA: hypothetical protein DDY13_02435 [Cytophagales bacterium]|jgi:TldD protein|nr:hypothetical protein [Cytophagales bacterium]